MRVNLRTFLAFQLNGAACCGRYDDVSIDLIKMHVEHGTIMEFLKERLGMDFDAGFLTPLDRMELLDEWMDMLGIVETRKFCVERNGLCLLVAYLLEGIQRRLWDARKLGLWREDELECTVDGGESDNTAKHKG